VWIISTIRPSNEYIGNHFPQIFKKKLFGCAASTAK
jgi:hypothetical protein